ncbi:hypothetical protein MN608_03457 [Microdochium nivale]|nr:hypothetical protein MN608_03457 [Microdochium nivale]
MPQRRQNHNSDQIQAPPTTLGTRDSPSSLPSPLERATTPAKSSNSSRTALHTPVPVLQGVDNSSKQQILQLCSIGIFVPSFCHQQTAWSFHSPGYLPLSRPGRVYVGTPSGARALLASETPTHLVDVIHHLHHHRLVITLQTTPGSATKPRSRCHAAVMSSLLIQGSGRISKVR